jgi:phage terminase large subunit-like protein
VKVLLNALIACGSSTERKEIIKGLEPRELELTLKDWETWAHLQQIAPDRIDLETNWATWLVMGERGSGKTRAGAEWVRARVRNCDGAGGSDGLRIALVGPSYAETREVMVEGVSGLLSLDWAGLQPRFISSRRMISWPNGAVAQLYSAEDPEELRRPQFELAWLDGTNRLPATLLRQMIGCYFVAWHWAIPTPTRP